MAKMTVNTRYSKDDNYEYETRLERINMDTERRKDVLSGNGFIVSSPSDQRRYQRSKWYLFDKVWSWSSGC